MPGPRTWVSEYAIHLGQFSTRGYLKSVRRDTSKETRTLYCTPTGGAVHQQYVDDDGVVWAKEELERKTATGVVLSAEAIAEAKKAELPNNVINVSVHDAAEVDGLLFPSEHNAYVFTPGKTENSKKKGDVPDPRNDAMYRFIVTAVTAATDKVFLGMSPLNNNEGLYRLITWKGQLVIQRQAYLDQVWQQHEKINVALKGTDRKKALEVVERLVTPFDPTSYRNLQAERLANVDTAPGDQTPIRADRPADIFDLTAAMDEVLNA